MKRISSLKLSSVKSSRLTGISLVVFASFCWGTSGIFIQNIIRKSNLSPIGLAFWRDLISTLILLLGILIFRPSLLIIKKRDLPWLIGMGVISIGTFHIFWNKSVVILGASMATVLQYNAPIIVAILARYLFNEPLTFRKIIAIILALSGTILVAGLFSEENWKIPIQDLLIALLSSVTYSSLSLFGKKLSKDNNPWTIMFYIFAIGTVTLFLYQAGRPEPWPSGSGVHFWILGFVLMATILGFGFFTKGLIYLPASIASITATSEIFFASAFAFLLLGEQLGGWQILGAILIISSVSLVSVNKSIKASSP